MGPITSNTFPRAFSPFSTNKTVSKPRAGTPGLLSMTTSSYTVLLITPTSRQSASATDIVRSSTGGRSLGQSSFFVLGGPSSFSSSSFDETTLLSSSSSLSLLLESLSLAASDSISTLTSCNCMNSCTVSVGSLTPSLSILHSSTTSTGSCLIITSPKSWQAWSLFSSFSSSSSELKS